ncbi:MAG: glycoside hydrolase family 73 protein, partial [Trebonia sp.]
MRSVRKPWWQQATALVTVSAGGVITGLNFVPGAATTMTSPASVPLHLLALEQAAQPGTFTNLAVGGDTAATATSDAQLRAAIVNVAGYYARLAKTRTPTQMEALIWDNTSSDGADHGESCAAFASLTLELAAQAVGQQSWVTGGESYPWPMPEWADARVDTNPASPQITSVVGDAQAHGRWHQVGDGYQPQAGDWAVYDGHVEVVTSYADGVFDTIGADSLPGLTVNAHSSSAPLAEQGVAGFVDNGDLKPTSGALAPSAPPAGHASSPAPAQSRPAGGNAKDSAAKPAPAATAPEPASAGHTGTSASPAIPGVLGTGDLLGRPAPGTGTTSGQGEAAAAADPTPSIPGLAGAGATTGAAKATGTAVVPGAVPTAAAATPASHPAAAPSAAPSASPRTSARPASTPSAPSSSAGQRYATPGTTSQQAFISLVAPGAIAAQQRFGVPAAVTIAQAIEESAWGQSGLAAQYHNLFGIKGTGPAGSVSLPTSEYEGGQWVTIDAPFRVYHNDAESIADHAELLATSGYYTRAMADRAVPDAFANDLTGVYATDPNYGANLVALMKLYNLYQFDSASG